MGRITCSSGPNIEPSGRASWETTTPDHAQLDLRRALDFWQVPITELMFTKHWRELDGWSRLQRLGNCCPSGGSKALQKHPLYQKKLAVVATILFLIFTTLITYTIIVSNLSLAF